MNPSRGVIYYNVGTSCVVRLLVSLHSLRKHYVGPVTICLEGDDAKNLFKKIDLSLLRVDIKDVTEICAKVPAGPSHTYLKTTLAIEFTPYFSTIWLDADTLVRGSLNELFELAEKHELVVPNFANWKTTGKTIAKRIRSWSPYYPELIEKALAFGPAINCGVQAFTKKSQFMYDWYEKTLPGREIYICNETNQQIMIPNYPHFIADQKFNCSCRYSNPKDPDTRVIHYHGRKHCRIGLPHAGDLWFATYQELTAKNVANINDWSPAGDRQLKNYLNTNKIESGTSLSSNPKYDPSTWKEGSKQMTIVTAVTPNYLDKLKLTAPTWIKKPQFKDRPLLIFVNGFDDPEEELDFLYELFNEVTIVEWEMPKADSKRELMLSAFVLGAPNEVKTPYWVKVDCDTFFFNEQDVFLPHHFDYDLAASSWHYSKPGVWLVELDKWAADNQIPGDAYLKPEQIEEATKSRRYGHKRIASWICLHKTDFSIEVAKYCGTRLPVPSHDTVMWFLAQRLPHRKYAQHKFKKQGCSTSTNIEVIRERIKNGA